MQFGPLSQSDINKLKELLDSQGAQYNISYSHEDLQSAREEKRQNQIVTNHPTFAGQMNFLYIDIELKDLMIVRGELERMGFAVAREVENPPAEVSEYLCEKCDFVSNLPGTCPQHGGSLLEFSDFALAKKLTREKRQAQFLWIFVLIVAIAIATNGFFFR